MLQLIHQYPDEPKVNATDSPYPLKGVWRDDQKAWTDIIPFEELEKIEKRSVKENGYYYSFVDPNGQEQVDRFSMAKKYCENLIIPGLEHLKWTVPDLEDFLRFGYNKPIEINRRINRHFSEAFPHVHGIRVWCSNTVHHQHAFSFGSGIQTNDVRWARHSVQCVSRTGL